VLTRKIIRDRWFVNGIPAAALWLSMLVMVSPISSLVHAGEGDDSRKLSALDGFALQPSKA